MKGNTSDRRNEQREALARRWCAAYFQAVELGTFHDEQAPLDFWLVTRTGEHHVFEVKQSRGREAILNMRKDCKLRAYRFGEHFDAAKGGWTSHNRPVVGAWLLTVNSDSETPLMGIVNVLTTAPDTVRVVGRARAGTNDREPCYIYNGNDVRWINIDTLPETTAPQVA